MIQRDIMIDGFIERLDEAGSVDVSIVDCPQEVVGTIAVRATSKLKAPVIITAISLTSWRLEKVML